MTDVKADGILDVKYLIIKFGGLGVLVLFFIISLKESACFLVGWV